jgi:cysteine desulfurase
MNLYFDYAATTPVDPRVVEKMMPFLTLHFGNAASTHSFGQQAKKAIDDAREQVAAFIQANPAEIIWTSGATESNNLAIRGIAALYQRKGKHIVTVKTEHPSVLASCQQLEKEGFTVTYLSPEKNGRLPLDKFEQSLRSDTILVSVMHVNNETGVIQEIEKIAAITAAKNILFHVDAVQSAGKTLIDVKSVPVDLLSLSAHKIYGPKGIGILYVRRKPRVRVAPLLLGGGQEHGMRSGTLATHQIVGMGEASAIANNEMNKEYDRLQGLRTYFWNEIKVMRNIFLNSDFSCSVPHIINFGIKGIDARNLIGTMPAMALAVGSACQSKGIEPSYVLRAMGLSHEDATASLRVSLGRMTVYQEINELITLFKTLYR